MAETAHGPALSAHNPALALTQLTVSDFRNYSELRMRPAARLIALCGPNGAGKTNLLEAVSLLAPGRGLRGATFEDLARHGARRGWAISAEVAGGVMPVRLGTAWMPDDGNTASGNSNSRQVRIDGKTYRGSGALAGFMRVIWLTPAMDRLFAGPASERRRFLDRLTAAFDPAHGTRINALERLLRERNRLNADTRPNSAWLDSIESQLAEVAVAVSAARVDAVRSLRTYIRKMDDTAAAGSFPTADIVVDGALEHEIPGRPAVQIEDEYRKLLADSRAADRLAGRTQNGPHRSDLTVRHGSTGQAARMCSTGEQKALLIGLILAQARAVRDAFDGIAPVLLLDEIAAHLDNVRRDALMADLAGLGAQVWMTGTDETLFSPRDGLTLYRVADGAVSEIT